MPEQSTHHYLRSKHLELGRAIANRRKIYLDLRFWIIARDAALGVRSGASSRKLLHFLRRGVANGSLICPIGSSVFSELMKQPYSEGRRIGTTRLVDELSLGVTLATSQTVTGTEIHSWMLEPLGTDHLYPTQELIWTKMAYVLGEIHPSLPDVDPDLESTIQRLFVDKMWTLSLSEIVRLIADKWPTQRAFEGVTDEINAGNAAHADELHSFEQALRQETVGVADVGAPIAADVLAGLQDRFGTTSKQQDWHVRTGRLRNRLFDHLGTDSGRQVLRTLYIQAALHASARWNKGRRVTPNDVYDFDHASVAVGYCDAFLTEGSLHHMLASPRLRFKDIYDCRVIADLDEAVQFLRDASRRPRSLSNPKATERTTARREQPDLACAEDGRR